MVLTFPLMSAIQLVSAHRAGHRPGLAGHHPVVPRHVVGALVTILVVANTINIGADLAAMGAAAELVVGGGAHFFTIAFALVSVALQLFIPYDRYAPNLKWLTLSLFAYVAVLFSVQVNWAAALRGLVWPNQMNEAVAVTIVAVFGTTIGPPPLLLASLQEAEEVATHPDSEAAENGAEGSRQGVPADPLRHDQRHGLLNLIALAIMTATAATLHAQGVTTIENAADAAEALRPVAGNFAFALFAIGSSGPACSQCRSRRLGGLRGGRSTRLARGAGISPARRRVLFGHRRGNGHRHPARLGADRPDQDLVLERGHQRVVAVPLMAAMMLLVSRRSVMGRFTAPRALLIFGWAAAAVMFVAAAVMLSGFLP